MKAVFDLKEAMDKKMISTNRKVVTFGEVMLRLTAPDFRRFSQTNEFIATYGGSEANVAVSLANFGIPTEFVTRLPDNAMAQAGIASLRANGLGTEGIVFGGKRMGLYFLESGASFRNSNVVYDREGSSFATLRPGMIDWEKIFADADWFHWSGIAASLSQEGADACLEALQTADRMGLTISCDLNVRKKLWNYGRSVADVMLPLVQYSDVIFGAEPEYKEVFDIAPEGFQAVDTASPLDLKGFETFALPESLFRIAQYDYFQPQSACSRTLFRPNIKIYRHLRYYSRSRPCRYRRCFCRRNDIRFAYISRQ